MTDGAAELALPSARKKAFAEPARGFHWGDICRSGRNDSGGKPFCCAGCRTIFELLTENGLEDFYAMGASAGVKVKSLSNKEEFRFLDEPSVQRRVIDFTDDRLTRVRFRAPAI